MATSLAIASCSDDGWATRLVVPTASGFAGAAIGRRPASVSLVVYFDIPSHRPIR